MSKVSFDFKGKNFAVTGASSGIGKQVVLDLLEAGANVLALARRKELMDEVYCTTPPPFRGGRDR
ncbi:MAG: SDR family NAD(P)-dependent oxidoreductase [Selenomonadaceae bacterium]|nr:SDR family NAD(P)-dependent oxidoreductase [Selenomonadaceae bacterium]